MEMALGGIKTITSGASDFNTVSIQNPASAMYGINYSALNNFLTNGNTVFGTSTTINSRGNYPVGIQYSNVSCNGFTCDNVDETYTGIGFSGVNTGTYIYGTSLGSHSIGLRYMQNSQIPGQCAPAGQNPIDPNPWFSPDITWNGNYNIYAAENDNSGFTPVFQPILLLYSPTSSPQNYNPISRSLPYDFYFIPTLTFHASDFNAGNLVEPLANGNWCWPTVPNYCGGGGDGGGGLVATPNVTHKVDMLDRLTMEDSLSFSNYSTELNYQAQAQVYSRLKDDTIAANSDSMAMAYVAQMDTLNIGIIKRLSQQVEGALNLTNMEPDLPALMSYKDSLMKSMSDNQGLMIMNKTEPSISELFGADSVMGSNITTVDSIIIVYFLQFDSLKALAISSAASGYDSIIPANLVESNIQLFNSVYLNTLALGIDTFTAGQINNIAYLAFQCPLQGGDAVYKARSLYALINDTVYDDLALCGSDTSSHGSDRMLTVPLSLASTSKDSVVSIYSLFPNPANEKVTILSNEPFCEDCRLVILDAEGQEVARFNLSAGTYSMDVDTRSFQPALYLVRISNNNKDVFKAKLNIIR